MAALTYSWNLPSGSGDKAFLRLSNRAGWLCSKEFVYRNQRVFRRGLFSGIDCQFSDPESGGQVHLKVEPIGVGPRFQPALAIDGEDLEEATGTPPPRVPFRPRSLAIITGTTYLLLLMAAVMLPSVSKILNAVYLRFEDRKLIMQVAGDEGEAPKQALIVRELQFPPAQVGRPYTTSIVVEGGTEPYQFKSVPKRWPKDFSIDPLSGEIKGTPLRKVDVGGRVEITDAAGDCAECPFAIILRGDEVPDPKSPTIVTERLDIAHVGQDYRFQLEVRGGKPPYDWSTVKSDLPKGLELDSESGMIAGSAEEPGDYLLTFRVIDSSYDASNDIYPWIIPVLSTALCLLGYWNMRKWGVVLFALLIVCQWGMDALEVAPISNTALILESILLAVGLLHIRAMD